MPYGLPLTTSPAVRVSDASDVATLPVSFTDTGNVATSLASLTRTAGEVVSGSPYGITSGTFNALTGSAAGNYSAPTVTGSPTLTITRAALTGTIANQTKVY